MSIADRSTPSGSVRFQVRWRHDGRQESRLFSGPDAQRNAEALAGIVHGRGDQISVERALEALDGIRRRPDGPTVRDWSARWVASLVRPSGDTVARYRRDLDRHVLPALGDIPLADLTRGQVQLWVTDQLAQVAPKTVINRHGMLSSLLDGAVRAELVPRNVAKGLAPALSSTHREMVFVSPAEWAMIARCLPPGTIADLCLLLIATGARVGEATAMTVDQVTIGRHLSVRIDRAWKKQADGSHKVEHPKTRRGVRTVECPEALRDVLIRATKDKRPSDLLFIAPRGGRVLPTTVWRTLREASEAAGKLGLDKRPRVHDLRHSCASWLIAAGVPLTEIQRQLGHESIQTTSDRYGHLMPSDGRVGRAMQAMLES